MHTETYTWQLPPAINLLGELGSADNKLLILLVVLNLLLSVRTLGLCHNPSPILAACHLKFDRSMFRIIPAHTIILIFLGITYLSPLDSILIAAYHSSLGQVWYFIMCSTTSYQGPVGRCMPHQL